VKKLGFVLLGADEGSNWMGVILMPVCSIALKSVLVSLLLGVLSDHVWTSFKEIRRLLFPCGAPMYDRSSTRIHHNPHVSVFTTVRYPDLIQTPILSLDHLLAPNHLLAHHSCELNSCSNPFKKIAKSHSNLVEYGGEILYYLSGFVDR
jgi:hypothetical protein